MTHNDKGRGPCRYYGETAVFTFDRKVFFGQKIVFSPKKGYFFICQLFSVVPFFLGPKTRFSARKSFFAITSNFVNGLIEAFGKTVHWQL